MAACRSNPQRLCPEREGCKGACVRMFDASAVHDARVEHDRQLRERFQLGEAGERPGDFTPDVVARAAVDEAAATIDAKPLLEASDREPTPSERAAALVNGPRQADYGHPLPNHERIAGFFTVRLRDKLKPGEVIEPHEAAALMRLVKEARLMQTRGHKDSLDDLAGYADVEWLIHERQAGA